MMHNSLLIRERLLRTNVNPLHIGRRDPHRFIRTFRPDVRPGEGELALDGQWAVRQQSDHPAVREAARDLQHFLHRFGLPVSDRPSRWIELRLDPNVPSGTFQRTVTASIIEISSSDSTGLWAGVVGLERELAVRQAPIVELGTVRRRPSWNVQISQAPFGSNYLVPDLSEPYLSDDAFRMLAHYGINGMTIYGDWLLYVESDIFPELNAADYDRHIAVLKDAAQRALKFGVRLYYVPVSPKLAEDHPLFARKPSARGARIHPGLSEKPKSIYNLCSSDPEVLAFHGETMSNLFVEVPELGGLNLIIGGESYYHCYMRPDRRGLADGRKTNCPRCAERTAEQVVNGLLKATADAVHGVKPEAPVAAWPYSAFVWSSDPAQLELLQTMDEGVVWLNTIDKDQWAQKNGYKKLIWDYSVDYTGPADNLLAQADLVKERGMSLFVKSETALGLECIQLPYMPGLQRLAEKWRNVASVRPDGVLQSWMFFGMWGSRAEELGWWTSWHPERTTEEITAAMARRDFGDSAPAVVRAWELISRAASHYPYIATYFTGPEFIGPAHPLLFERSADVPDGFHALLYYLQENEETFSTTVTEVKHSLVMDRVPHQRIRGVMKPDDGRDVWELFMSEYRKALSYAEQAFELLDGLEPPDDPEGRQLLREEQLLGELVYRTFRTICNSYSFPAMKEELANSEEGKAAGEATFRTPVSTAHPFKKSGFDGSAEALTPRNGPGGEADYTDAMLAVAEDELDNTRQARHIFIEAPWFDLSLRVDGNYPSSLRMIDRKTVILQEAISRRKST